MSAPQENPFKPSYGLGRMGTVLVRMLLLAVAIYLGFYAERPPGVRGFLVIVSLVGCTLWVLRSTLHERNVRHAASPFALIALTWWTPVSFLGGLLSWALYALLFCVLATGFLLVVWMLIAERGLKQWLLATSLLFTGIAAWYDLFFSPVKFTGFFAVAVAVLLWAANEFVGQSFERFGDHLESRGYRILKFACIAMALFWPFRESDST